MQSTMHGFPHQQQDLNGTQNTKSNSWLRQYRMGLREPFGTTGCLKGGTAAPACTAPRCAGKNTVHQTGECIAVACTAKLGCLRCMELQPITHLHTWSYPPPHTPAQNSPSPIISGTVGRCMAPSNHKTKSKCLRRLGLEPKTTHKQTKCQLLALLEVPGMSHTSTWINVHKQTRTTLKAPEDNWDRQLEKCQSRQQQKQANSLQEQAVTYCAYRRHHNKGGYHGADQQKLQEAY